MINTDTMRAEIDTLTQLLSTNNGVKYFSPLLEEEFQQEFLGNYFHQIRLTLLFSFFLFNGSAFLILAFFPNWQFPFSVIVNMGSPILLVLMLLSYANLYVNFIQYIMLVSTVTILICLAIVAAAAPLPLKDLIYMGMLLPPLFISTLGNLQFRYSVVVMITTMIASNLSYQFSDFIESHNYYSFIVCNYILLGGTSLCLVSSFFNEQNQRTQFLYGKLLRLKNNLLEHLTNYDALTDAANRRLLDTMLDNEWRRTLREKQPMGVLYLDLDYFKNYNDIYGHLLGDKALKSIARALFACVRRPGDLVARYDSDEYIILLPNTSLEAAIIIAQKVQLAIKNLKIEHSGSDISDRITATIGLASITPSVFIKPIIVLKRADTALNNGKKVKRNSIYSYDEEEPLN